MNYQQALAFTQSLPRLGGSPGLACVKKIMKRLGNPQEKLRVIHVAGTNGKGSVCVMTASVLQAAGYRVGLFTSPYLVDFRERFQLNGTMISQADYAQYANAVRSAMEQSGETLSQFAFITAVAFCWFAHIGCDFVVLETGLGGRLDATNIITKPAVTAITSISFDHTELLGKTIAAIAREKCGIMKQGCTAVLSPGQPMDAVTVAMEQAALLGCSLVIPNSSSIHLNNMDADGTSFEYGGNIYRLSLRGEYQPQNAVTAIEIIIALQKQGVLIEQSAIQKGLLTANHPGRCQVLRKRPLVLLDGAHNPGGAAALAGTLSSYIGNHKAIGVCGVMNDKAAKDLAAAMAPHLEQLVAVTPENGRALPAETLANVFAPFCPVMVKVVDKSLCDWIQLQTKPVVIFGSLYLAGTILQLWDDGAE